MDRRVGELVIEVGDAELTMAARIATGDERERIWAHQIEHVPQFTELAATIEREVPVVVLEPIIPAHATP